MFVTLVSKGGIGRIYVGAVGMVIVVNTNIGVDKTKNKIT